jgi:hypothetical protein
LPRPSPWITLDGVVQGELVEQVQGDAAAIGDPGVADGDDVSGLLVERLLREPERIWRQIALERNLGQLNRQLVAASSVPLAIYGAVLGASNGTLQAVASAVKLPVLFLLTLAICLPALYLFNLVFGSRLRLAQTLAIVLCAIATTSVLTLGFAPISVFFLLSAPSYGFFKLLNVAVLALTGLAGLRILVSGMAKVAVAGGGSSAGPQSRTLLRGWLVIYAFVGTQLAWTLRPFFGAPGLPFELFRRLEGNFYVNIFQTLFG